MANSSGPTKEEARLRDKLVHNVAEEVQLRPAYFLLLSFSAIIAALGLLTNSTAIVIGAMLISPLFWPIMGVTLSLFRSRKKLARQSLLLLGLSIVIVIIIGAIVGWIAPIDDISTEILVRTQPTIVDLIIALATSVIAVMAIFYPRISSTATGVAISIALLPPLTVSGIGIAFGSWSMFSRSFLLFGTNVVAMIFAGMITLYFLHFKPRRKTDQARMKIGFISSFVSLLILAVPLSIYFKNTLDSDQIQELLQTTLRSEVMAIAPEANIENIQVEYIPTLDSEVKVQATMYIPEGSYLTEADQANIIEGLTTQVDRTVDLQLDVVNTVQLRREQDEETAAERTAIETTVLRAINDINPAAQIESVTIGDVSEATIDVLVSLRQQDTSPISFDQKETIAEELTTTYGTEFAVEVELIPVERLARPDQQAQRISTIRNVLTQDAADVDANIDITDITIEPHAKKKFTYLVTAHMYVPNDVPLLVTDREIMQQHISSELEEPTELELRIFRFEEPSEPEPIDTEDSPEPETGQDS